MPLLTFFVAALLLGSAYYPLCGLPVEGAAYQGLLLLTLLGWLWVLRRIASARVAASPPVGLAGLLALLQAPLVLAAYVFQARVQWGRIQVGVDRTGPALALLVAVGLWAWAWKKDLPPARVALAGVLAGLALQLGSMAAFQLGHFSDMLLSIQAAGQAFLHGASPYSEMDIIRGEVLRTTYLPGLWLAYLPTSALGVDPRWMNLAFLSAFAARFYLGSPEPRRAWAAALLLLFFANPWLALRHELYVPALLWLMAVVFWAQAREKPWLEAIAVGALAASSQLLWPFAGVWLLWRSRTEQALAAWAGSALAFLLLLLPFVWLDGPGLWAGVFGHWGGAVEVTHFNLYHWLPWLPLMALLQVGGFVAAAVLVWRRPEAGPWGPAALATGAFFLGLFHVSHYFYFILLTLLLFTWIRHVDRH